jgi:hypothetical protein
VSIDFDRVKVDPARRRLDPARVVIVVVAIGLAVAIVKPWTLGPTPDAKPPPVALAEASASVAASGRPSASPATEIALPPTSSGIPAPTWAEVAPIIETHDAWGVRAILLARRPSLGIPASPRFVERWTRTTPNSSTVEIARVARDDQVVVALGVTVPSGIEPLDMRVWKLGANDVTRWIDGHSLDRTDRDGSFTFIRSDPAGGALSWPAGHYRVDLLAADGSYSIAVQIPGRFGIVPAPDDSTSGIQVNVLAPDASDPSGVQFGPFAMVDGVGVPLEASQQASMSDEEAWRMIVEDEVTGGSSRVASEYLPRASGLGVMLTNHADVTFAAIARLAPDARVSVAPMIGGISELRGQTPWVAFAPRAGGVWPPGVYAITVGWTDPAGWHRGTWHVELRPGPTRDVTPVG